jgi:hypothetical protein
VKTGRISNSRRQMTTLLFAILSVAVAILASIRTERTFVAECTVVVKDESGLPAPQIRVTEDWYADSFEFKGGDDILSDSHGRVSFPRGTARHSLLFWLLRPVLTQLYYGVHASLGGTSAHVGISQLGVESTEGFSCSNKKCIDHPIELQFRIKRK